MSKQKWTSESHTKFKLNQMLKLWVQNQSKPKRSDQIRVVNSLVFM